MDVEGKKKKKKKKKKEVKMVNVFGNSAFITESIF
jgi:hypothetical protein